MKDLICLPAWYSTTFKKQALCPLPSFPCCFTCCKKECKYRCPSLEPCKVYGLERKDLTNLISFAKTLPWIQFEEIVLKYLAKKKPIKEDFNPSCRLDYLEVIRDEDKV